MLTGDAYGSICCFREKLRGRLLLTNIRPVFVRKIARYSPYTTSNRALTL